VKVEIYGSMDDLIEIRIDGEHRHELGGSNSGNGRYARTLEVRAIGGTHGIRVHAIYDGCWSFAAGQPDGLLRSAIPPGWSVTVEQEHRNSTRLVLDTGAQPVRVLRDGGRPISDLRASIWDAQLREANEANAALVLERDGLKAGIDLLRRDLDQESAYRRLMVEERDEARAERDRFARQYAEIARAEAR